MSNIVDISYSVSEKELQGRRCLKNMETGKTWFEDRPNTKPVFLPKEAVTPLEDHVVIKPKAKPRTKWKHNAA